jgi:hypothetical protein
MDKQQRSRILRRLRSRGYTVAGWCRANGFSRRTVHELIRAGLGLKRGGEKTREILAALARDGFLDDRPDKEQR